MLTIAAHPVLEVAAFTTELAQPLGESPSPASLLDLLRLDAPAPLRSDDDVKKHVRDLLRVGGYKPTGRGKPASEYLLGAAGDGTMPRINLAVDACNAVSLHSGLPISVVDLDLARAPFTIAIAAPGTNYVFNASGQTIDVSGLVCLCDAEGPCANAVKDSQRTKTHAGTRRTLSIVWGTRALSGRAAAASRWYREILAGAGARCSEIRATIAPVAAP